MELYAAQQTLSRLQTQLEATENEKSQMAEKRTQIESDLQRLQEWHETRAVDTDAKKQQADERQKKLNALNQTLKQLEQQSEGLRSETSKTKQEAFAAEKESKLLEKEKLTQDVLIDSLSETLKGLHAKNTLFEAQANAQAKETKLARQTLAEANAEMESVNLEKRQLTSQWKSALVGNAKRDEALKVTREALHNQRQELLLIEAETNGKKAQAKEESRKNEQLLALLRKTENEANNAQKQLDKVLHRKEKLAETYERLVGSQEETDAALSRAKKEESQITDGLRLVEEDTASTRRSIQNLDEKMLANLSEQSTTEKDAKRVVASTQEMRRLINQEETSTTNVQNEIARCRIDVLHHRGLVDQLTEASAALEEETNEKQRTVEKYELEIQRRSDEIARKGMEVASLNRELDKRNIAGGGQGANLGPLEANIKHLSVTTEKTEKEIKELQRRWVGYQTELVALVNENNNLGEKTRRLKAELTVSARRRVRLQENHVRQLDEIKTLEFAMERARQDQARINGITAKHELATKNLLTDVMVTEREIQGSLEELEGQTITIETKVTTSTNEKRRLIGEVIEAERQIMLWERKIQLEKETQAALDPSVGGDVVGAMKREIQRMSHRETELKKMQEQLIRKVEQAVYKRETIGAKARLAKDKLRDELKLAKGKGGSLGSSGNSSLLKGRALKKDQTTKQGLKKACVELKGKIAEVKVEVEVVGQSVNDLSSQKELADEETAATQHALEQLRAREDDLRDARDAVEREAERVALEALKATRMLERFQAIDLKGGSEKSLDDLEADFDSAMRRREKLKLAVESIRQDAPQLEQVLERAVVLLSI